MGAFEISLIAFVLVFASAFLGMNLRKALSEDHLRDDVKDVVKLSTGLIGTIAALVLGLLIATAKSSYDGRNTQIKQITASIILLDGLLKQYGPEGYKFRVAIRSAVPLLIERIWAKRDNGKAEPFVATAEAEGFINDIQELKPDSDRERALQPRIFNAAADLAQTRLSLYAQEHDSIPMPFLTILIFWLMVIYSSFGLFVRPAPIVIITFFVGALSAAGAIFLILEMDQPFAGLLQISSEPLRQALAPLGP
jgi:hypothetical protein